MAGSLRWKIAQRTELKWWQHYLKNKDKATYLSWKHQYWNKLLKQLDALLMALGKAPFTNKVSLNILDAGCGPAGVYMALHKHRVDAFDPLLACYSRSLPHFNTTDYPWVAFETQSLEDFSADKTYDVVFCMNALNHVRDINKSTKRLQQAMKPGGLLIATLDTHNYSLFKYLFRALPGDVLHPHQHSLNEYEYLFKQHGIGIIAKHLIKRGFLFNHWLVVGQGGVN